MTTTVESPSAADAARARLNQQRWIQLIIGIVCMVMIANLQYGWTLFVTPMGDKHGWGKPAIQVAFTLFVAAETWLVPIEGWLVDKYGPRVVVLVGGALAGLGWVLDSMATSLPFLYFAQIVCGVGAGAVYGTCVGNALKWFPERRGLAAGLTAAGFGMGSAFTVDPIFNTINSAGYEAAFLYFGLGQGLVVFALAWLLRQPNAADVAALPKPAHKLTARKQYTQREMLGTPVFYVMYIMFVLMAAGGLFFTANLRQVAEAFGVSKVDVKLFGLTFTALTFALKIDRVLNGLTRPFFGWVSDKIGRENTMFIAFGLEAIGIFMLGQFGTTPLAFVLLSGMVFFAWGEIYSLFPATCADTYGWKFAAGNAGLLYTAKGTASLLVPIATWVATSASWHAVLWTSAAMNLTASIMAIVVLKPMRKRMLVRIDADAQAAPAPGPVQASA